MLVFTGFCYLHSIIISPNHWLGYLVHQLCINCCVSQDDIGVQAAIARIYVTQPLLFYMEDKVWVKVDNSAIELSTASCFAEAVELLLACFWVFNVEYPYNVEPASEVMEFLMIINCSTGQQLPENLPKAGKCK